MPAESTCQTSKAIATGRSPNFTVPADQAVIEEQGEQQGLSDELGQRRPAAGDSECSQQRWLRLRQCVASANHAQIAPTLTGTAASVISARPRS